jgi:UDP-N-acetylglucosamine 2-epimerase (non-hydrolysing)
MLITIVAGARPNFMKIAPIIKAIKKSQAQGKNIHFRIVHTGQHFDARMSSDIFKQLDIPEPDNNLGAGGGSQAQQTASIMVGFESELLAHKPDLVLVVGDVTSSMACTIVAKKMQIDVVHVEAGIRSGDMHMPEEINRILTDSVCDHFFTTSQHASDNLKTIGIPSNKIHFVGNTMIDTLLQNIDKIKSPLDDAVSSIEKGAYLLLTLHRPSNVDDPIKLQRILSAIISSRSSLPIVFPVHPRTRKVLDKIQFNPKELILLEPQPYLEFIYLIKNAKGIITDSGGITEEATVLNIPCITMRDSTERPETVLDGTNELVGDDLFLLSKLIHKMVSGNWKTGIIPDLWDGKTSERIVDVLFQHYSAPNSATLVH